MVLVSVIISYLYQKFINQIFVIGDNLNWE